MLQGVVDRAEFTEMYESLKVIIDAVAAYHEKHEQGTQHACGKDNACMWER